MVTSVPIGSRWDWAGRVYRILDTKFGDSYSSEEVIPLFLGKFNIIHFKDLDADYKVLIRVPRWFIDLNMSIWQYEGAITSPVDVIAEIDVLKTIIGV